MKRTDLRTLTRDGREPIRHVSASFNGAKASANFYSLIETAKANGLEPYAYLKRVFIDLPNATDYEDIEPLLPWHKAPRETQIAKSRSNGAV